MSDPESNPDHGNPATLGCRPEGLEDNHDQDLIEWLAANGIRQPDWSMDPCVFDQVDRQQTGERNPFNSPGEPTVAGVYLFYSRRQGEVVALYVGKASNLWNRMQTHWCRPGERGWVNSYLEDVDRGDLDDIVMACAWKEGERAGVEARLIKALRPRYCRRTE